MTRSRLGSVKNARTRRNGKRPYVSNGARLRNWLSRKYGERVHKQNVWED